MAAQSKPNFFGCTSLHRTSHRNGKEKQALSVEEFLALDEVKTHIEDNPGAVSYENGEAFLSEGLTLHYLHLSGNKKLKKQFKKYFMGGA